MEFVFRIDIGTFVEQVLCGQREFGATPQAVPHFSSGKGQKRFVDWFSPLH